MLRTVFVTGLSEITAEIAVCRLRKKLSDSANESAQVEAEKEE